jgi:hypothetical protein
VEEKTMSNHDEEIRRNIDNATRREITAIREMMETMRARLIRMETLIEKIALSLEIKTHDMIRPARRSCKKGTPSQSRLTFGQSAHPIRSATTISANQPKPQPSANRSSQKSFFERGFRGSRNHPARPIGNRQADQPSLVNVYRL